MIDLVGLSWLSFLIYVVIFLGNFYFIYYIRRSWALFNIFYLSRQSPNLDLAYRSWPTFVGSGSSGSLIFRPIGQLDSLRCYWAHIGLCWCFLRKQKGFPHVRLLTISRWERIWWDPPTGSSDPSIHSCLWISGRGRRVLDQTKLLALAGSLSFAYLTLYLQVENGSLRPGGEGRIASPSLCSWLGFQFISPWYCRGTPFNLGEECNYLVCLQLLNWWSGSTSLDCLLLLGLGTENTLLFFCLSYLGAQNWLAAFLPLLRV